MCDDDEDSDPFHFLRPEEVWVFQGITGSVSISLLTDGTSERNLNMVNIPLLRKCVEWVEEQAELHWRDREWNQSSWASDYRTPIAFLDPDYDRYLPKGDCGTTYCIAGYIAATHGWVPRKKDFRDDQFTKDGISRSASSIARDILGISIVDGHSLFQATATAQEIREDAERLAGERL